MKYDYANSFPENRCTHRKILSKKDGYVPIQDVVLEVLKSGIADSYESVSLDIRQDPLVVTVNEYCRMIKDDKLTRLKVAEICDSFNDTSTVFLNNGRRCVRAIDLFVSSRKELENLGIINQYELVACLSYQGTETEFDVVYLPDLDSVSKKDENKQETGLKDTKEFFNQYRPELSNMVMCFLTENKGKYVPITEIRNKLGVQPDVLNLILGKLAEENKITLDGDCAIYDVSDSKPASAYALDDLSDCIKNYLLKYPGKHISFDRICKDLNININLLQWLLRNIPDRSSYDVDNFGMMIKTHAAEAETENVSEKTIQSEHYDDCQNDCLDLIREYLSDKDGRQITSFELSRALSIPDYSVDSALDVLSKDTDYCVNAYGIKKISSRENIRTSEETVSAETDEKKDIETSIQTESHTDSYEKRREEKTETETTEMEIPVQKTSGGISEKSLDRKFIMSLFDGCMDYLPLSKIIAAYYRNNRKSQVDASEIMEILSESPFVVSFKNQYRPIYCSEEEFEEACEDSGNPTDRTQFDSSFGKNQHSFLALGINNSDEAFQIYSKRKNIQHNQTSRSSTETVIEKSEPEVDIPLPVKKEGDIDLSVLSTDLATYVREIMHDGNKRSAYYLRSTILQRYGKTASQEEIRNILEAMNYTLELVRDSPEVYRYPGNVDLLSKAEVIVRDFRDCICSSVKLYQHRKTKWEAIGILEPYEVFDIVTRLDRVSVIKENIVSFDGCEPSNMIYNRRYTKETLMNYYGVPSEWVRMRRF